MFIFIAFLCFAVFFVAAAAADEVFASNRVNRHIRRYKIGSYPQI